VDERSEPNKAVSDLNRGIDRLSNIVESSAPASVMDAPVKEELKILINLAKQVKTQLEEQALSQRMHRILDALSSSHTLDNDTLFNALISNQLEGMPFAHAVFQGPELDLKRRVLSFFLEPSGEGILPFLVAQDDVEWNTVGHILFKSPDTKANEFLRVAYFRCIEKLSEVGRRELFAIRNGEHKTVGALITKGCDGKAKQAYAQYVAKPTQALKSAFRTAKDVPKSLRLPSLISSRNVSFYSDGEPSPPAILTPKPHGTAPSLFLKRYASFQSVEDVIEEEEEQQKESSTLGDTGYT